MLVEERKVFQRLLSGEASGRRKSGLRAGALCVLFPWSPCARLGARHTEGA